MKLKHRVSPMSWKGKKILLGLSSLCLMVLMLFSGSSVYAMLTDEQITALGQITVAEARMLCLETGFTSSFCPPKGVENIIDTNTKWFISPTFRIALIQSVLNVAEFVSNRLAYEAAVAIASGGPGETSLFYTRTPSENWKVFGLDVAGEAFGQLNVLSNSELGIKYNLCQPGEILNLALAIGIKQRYQPEKPSCDILDVGKKWREFGSRIHQTYTDPQKRQEALLKTFAETLKPGGNELTAALRLNIALDNEVREVKLLKFLEQTSGTGYKDVVDFIVGNVETPSTTLQKDFEKKLENAGGDGSRLKPGDLVGAGELIGGLALSTASTFTNTLLAQLFSRIYSGLFDPKLDEFNFDDYESVAGGGRKSAQDRFASIIAPSPITTTEYNALSTFVVCPADGVINRGIYNCVMDVNFMAAVTRGTAGVPLTVQEAIDEGLLDGNWTLISSDNRSSNQDPFCYTYGFCYGNLVKLRKARVIPIGWELAALRNTGSTPATLQEIIDGFHSCTDQGTIGPAGASDTASKWCHLIDPNWVLKYPETSCRAIGTGEIRLSSIAASRQSACVDAPSCIGEDNDGNCTDGYGYCVQEKNVWRFRGDECPAEYATCLSVENTESGSSSDFLVNTVDYSVCGQDNAGCRWYRTNKLIDDAGTEETSDDTYEWLPDGEAYVVAERDDDWLYSLRDGSSSVRSSYAYTSDSGETYRYDSYAYEDRLYLTHSATECDESNAGCTQLYAFRDDLYLNAVQNPSFETDATGDGIADGWIFVTGDASLSTSASLFGSTSLQLQPITTPSASVEQLVSVADQNFYTFSAYAQASSSGASLAIQLELLDEEGDTVDTAGTSYAGDCQWNSSGQVFTITSTPSTTEFERVECLFTVPLGVTHVIVAMNSPLSSSAPVYVDGVQLELGEDANTFAVGYSTTAMASYYKLAPNYLGCSGSANDPEECDAYAQVCSAQEVGCNLYTPDDGDPSVPAIISEIDQCPSECVGYTTYKQEATAYESDEFPVYFIADSATACSQQYVGCDAYTNLGAVEAGGEAVEHYTSLRFCLSETIADSSTSAVTPATYFTWEGSDNAGYQLQTWSLLQSNTSLTTGVFTNTPFTAENRPDLAPCTNVQMTGPDQVECADTISHLITEVFGNADCDEHSDIFTNPDCREFFDTEGNAHYREYSDTISISNACSPYRKDDGNQTDCEGSGGYWTDQGFCRYYVLPEESTSCPSAQNGCRSYTGGMGRNATTILNETFEGGTYADFAMADTSANATSVSSYISTSPSRIVISNESVATDGHSLYVSAPSSGIAGVETVYISNGGTYDQDDATTCSGTVTSSGCELTSDNNGGLASEDESCVVADGAEHCGTLVDSLVAGKTFVLDFWAKGSGDLYVTLEEDQGSGDAHDFVSTSSHVTAVSGLTPIALDGAWTLYSLGPLDTSDYTAFDASAVVRFAISAGGEFYMDNIVLKQVQENVTLIKDSWVVPSTCDQTPEFVDAPQYYLGCESYTDQNGSDVDLYQFSDLCSEDVVGCTGFHNTQNSASAYQQIHNARCVRSDFGDFTEDEGVAFNISCEIDGVTYCTISAGRSYCTFDTDTVFAQPLPIESSIDGYFRIAYGPETTIVQGDTPVYIVADSSDACNASYMGCQEVGVPTYSQNLREVESFTSAYYINLPSSYDTILCENDAVFCEEWSTTKSGNLYFKDPVSKTCEWKTSVTIENRSYSGWFQSGTTDPCYWEDKDGDGVFSRSSGDESFLIAGEEFGVWRNGDEDDGDDDTWDYYDGWVASCETRYDLCTEFIDVVDTGGGLNESGQSYYFTNDDLLSEDYLTDSQRCNGLVSQKFGCALLNNTTNSALNYNASATYVTSLHADVFYGTAVDSLVDPVSCSTEGGGTFTISASDDAIAGTSTSVDLCARRCEYTLDSGDRLTTDYAQEGDSDTQWFERSCFVDTDCPTLTTADNDTVTAECGSVSSDYRLQDDSNEVLKVNRDRSCSAWLACESSRTSWDANANRYQTICDSINLCRDGVNLGDQTTCTVWEERDPEILTDFLYSARDVTWSGYDYSGMSIPNQLPVELYNQFNIQPDQACVNPDGDYVTLSRGEMQSCSTATDCEVYRSGTFLCTSNSDCESGACDISSGYCHLSCSEVEPDYRLVYNAGTCDSDASTGVGIGGECVVGYCADSPEDSCQDGDDCGGGECVVGYCQAMADTNCVNADCACNPDNNAEDGTNTACAGSRAGSGAGFVSTPSCDPIQFVCVNTAFGLTGNSCVTVSECGSFSSRSNFQCVTAASSIVGSCFNNSCLVDVVDEDGDQVPDLIDTSDLRGSVCRSYPEMDSPFPYQVVSGWKKVGTDIDTSSGLPTNTSSSILTAGASEIYPWSIPYNYVSGYQDSKVCGPTDDYEANNDCLCSYDKVSYENGTQVRYYEFGSVLNTPVMEGICTSGSKANFPCSDDAECDSGTCALVSNVDSIYGWHGYCIEKDSSIQINGSSDTDDQACLSWLPIDQLAGATDLYGKSMEAGYPLQDTYFCSETAIYYDLYPTGSRLKSNGELADLQPACADSGYGRNYSWLLGVPGLLLFHTGYCSYGEDFYGKDDVCVDNALCPTGYYALLAQCESSWTKGGDADGHVGFCDKNYLNDYRANRPNTDDCPYFCIHKDSLFTDVNEEGDDDSLIGTSCVELLDECYEKEINDSGLRVFKIGGLHAGSSTCSDRIKAVSPTDGSPPGSGDKIFQNCVTRGVSEWYSYGASVNQHLPVRGVTAYLNEDDGYKMYSERYSNLSVGPMIDHGIGQCEYSKAVCFDDDDCEGTYDTGLGKCSLTVSACTSDHHCTGGTTDVCIFVTAPSNLCVLVDVDEDSRDGRGSAMPYLGCVEVVQVASVDPDVTNKAWTHRLWTESGYETGDRSDFSYDSGLYPFEYSASDEPQTAGRLLFGEVYSQEGDYWVIPEFREDSFPAPVQGTRTDIVNIYWGTGIMTAPEDYRTVIGATIWSYPYDMQWMLGDEPVLPSGVANSAWLGLPYEKLRAIDGTHEAFADTSTEGLIDDFGNSTSSDKKSVRELLSQLFAKVYNYWRYDETAGAGVGYGGGYTDEGAYTFDISSGEDSSSGTDIDEFGDTSAELFPQDEEDRAPKLYSVGSCIGTNCYEKSEGKFTVNEIDAGTIEGDTYKQVNLNFYVAAAPNQLPLKNLIVDWGDAFTFNTSSGDAYWPTDSQSGSTAEDNFYKNHRGMNASGENYCSLEDEWGRTNNTCSSSYVSFSHSYSCSASRVSALASRECELGDRGQLLNAPCTGGDVTGGGGACVFQPRVHAKDNWGWCTGFCDSNPDDDSDACYDRECNVDACPSGDYAGYACPDQDGDTVDPWIYFDGYVIVTP